MRVINIIAETSALILVAFVIHAHSDTGSCSAPSSDVFTYTDVFSARRSEGISFAGASDRRRTHKRALPKMTEPNVRSSADLPGFTRSVYDRDHALVTPESRVWTGLDGWCAVVRPHRTGALLALGTLVPHKPPPPVRVRL
jgi:hypothetical protein